MFYLIEFDDVDSPETKETMSLFYHSPNGTCLSSFTNIRLPNLSKDKWIIYADEELQEFSSYNNLFTPLDI
uniref:Uncharacterized protein n=1 Tax=viral metagenome TaxID=1070528 RepID=A0A6C0IVX9_9ZZZZ